MVPRVRFEIPVAIIYFVPIQIALVRLHWDSRQETKNK